MSKIWSKFFSGEWERGCDGEHTPYLALCVSLNNKISIYLIISLRMFRFCFSICCVFRYKFKGLFYINFSFRLTVICIECMCMCREIYMYARLLKREKKTTNGIKVKCTQKMRIFVGNDSSIIQFC